MTEAQRLELKKLIRNYGRASEDLGSVPSSLYWNSAYAQVEAAEKEIDQFLANLVK